MSLVDSPMSHHGPTPIALGVKLPIHAFSLFADVVHYSADMEVRRKVMNIILSMTSSGNVEEVVLFLKKQLQKTQEADFEKVHLHARLSFGGSGVIPSRPRNTVNSRPIDPRHCDQIL